MGTNFLFATLTSAVCQTKLFPHVCVCERNSLPDLTVVYISELLFYIKYNTIHEFIYHTYRDILLNRHFLRLCVVCARTLHFRHNPEHCANSMLRLRCGFISLSIYQILKTAMGQKIFAKAAYERKYIHFLLKSINSSNF